MNEQAIIAACAEHGLEVSAVRYEGLMLQLTPSSTDALPGAEVLTALSAQLREIAPPTRWVTLVIEHDEH